MGYGSEAMKTFTARATAAEIERLDAIAAILSDVVNERTGRTWWRVKRGRGDVVRLAVMLLEQRLGRDVPETPAGRAQAGLYRESVRQLLDGELLDELAARAGGASGAPEPIPGQTTIDDAA